MYGYTDTSGVGERVSKVVTNNVSPVRCAVLSEACALPRQAVKVYVTGM